MLFSGTTYLASFLLLVFSYQSLRNGFLTCESALTYEINLTDLGFFSMIYNEILQSLHLPSLPFKVFLRLISRKMMGHDHGQAQHRPEDMRMHIKMIY